MPKTNLSAETCRILRKALITAQENRCYLCGDQLHPRDAWIGKAKSFNAYRMRTTFDHVEPRTKDGADNWRNILLCHGVCNENKADRDPYPCELLYLEYIKFYMPTSALSELSQECL